MARRFGFKRHGNYTHPRRERRQLGISARQQRRRRKVERLVLAQEREGLGRFGLRGRVNGQGKRCDV